MTDLDCGTLATSETPVAPASPLQPATFLREFRARHGRAPRILHVGNIANNAYLNAKFLNAAGFDCDVICYDYYHLMACPEWEDADFEGTITDHFRPDWSALDLRGFERPPWFAQGPRPLCIDYLIARRTGRRARTHRVWQAMGAVNKTRRGVGPRESALERAHARARRFWWLVRATPNGPARLWAKLEAWASPRGNRGWLVAATAVPFLMVGVFALRWMQWLADRRERGEHGADTVAELPNRFGEVFPQRPDQLRAQDYQQFMPSLPMWAALFRHYDIVQAYATDVLYPLMAQQRPYLGFEHGTLRDFTLADNAVSRLTALGYQQADHVFITNGDCLAYAHKIHVQSYSAMIHPVDEGRIRNVPADAAAVHREFGARYVFLCPIRHDWSVKGTDQYIRALPLIAARLGRDCRVVMCRWGMQVADSEELARRLGVDDLIAWREPFNRAELVRMQKSCDIVFDQIALPHFGATAPQAIAAGVPVIMSYDPASTTWIIEEPAPILSAWTPEQIAAAVEQALDPVWRAAYQQRARLWFDTYHSSRQVVARSAAAYHEVCRNAGLL